MAYANKRTRQLLTSPYFDDNSEAEALSHSAYELYRSLIADLRCLVGNTWLNIAFGNSLQALNLKKASVTHFNLTKHILRYLKTTVTHTTV